jgi:hypothetical protein
MALHQLRGPVPSINGRGRTTSRRGRRTCRGAQAFDDFRRLAVVGRQLAGALQTVQPLQRQIEAAQAVTHIGGRQRPGTRACGREDVLGSVHQMLHRGEFHDARAALQRVERAEHLVEFLRIARRLFQGEQALRGLLGQFAAFDQELLQEFVHCATPHNIAANCTSFSRSMGLTR